MRSIAVLIGLNLVFSFLLPGVAWQVHVGGLLTGAVVAVVFSLAGGLRPGRARVPSVGAQAAGTIAQRGTRQFAQPGAVAFQLLLNPQNGVQRQQAAGARLLETCL